MKRKLSVSILAFALVFAVLFNGIVFSNSVPVQAGSPQKYLISFQNGLPADVDAVLAGAGGKVTRKLPEIGGVEAEAADGSFLAALKAVPGIQGANRELSLMLGDPIVSADPADFSPVTDIPQDAASYWDYQWDVKRVTKDGASFGIETGGRTDDAGHLVHKAVVAVIDTGIDTDHPDLQGNLLGGVNFVPATADPGETGDPADILDRQGHGTHVAGAIAANGKVKGVGPGLGIRAYRVFPAAGGAPTSWIAAAIVRAADDGVDVINLSASGYDSLSSYTFQGETYKDTADIQLWKRAIRYAVNKNVIVVTAAGNESLNLDNPKEITNYLNSVYGPLGYVFKGASKEVPGTIPGVVNVSASSKWTTAKLAFYSNFGSGSIDVAAPGGDLGPAFDATGDLNQSDFHNLSLSTWPTYLPPVFTSNLTGYALLQGTSMASPKVAAVAGLIRAAHPGLKPEQVTRLIERTAVDLGRKGRDPLFGFGEANAYQALAKKTEHRAEVDDE